MIFTIPVIIFQAVIVFTLASAGRAGYPALFLVTAGWTLFTLFGSIYTAGLMLFQLISIYFGYQIGHSNARGKRVEKPKESPPPPSNPDNFLTIFVVLGILGFGIWVFLFPNVSNQSPPIQEVVPTEKVGSPPSPIAQPGESFPPETAPPHKSKDRNDLRNCLELKSNAAIAKCTEISSHNP